MQFNHPLSPVVMLAIVFRCPQSFLLEVQPIPAKRFGRPSLLNVEAAFTRTVLLFVRRCAQLVYTPLLDDVLRSVEILHHIDVMVQLVNVTLPRQVVAFHE